MSLQLTAASGRPVSGTTCRHALRSFLTGTNMVFVVPKWDRRAVSSQRASWETPEVVDDEVAVVMERELALLTPEVRGSADQLEDLLDPDFAEIGKSGRLWTRAELIAALVAAADPEKHTVVISEMSGRSVGSGFVLLTYVTQVEGQRARRSSLWRQSMKGWRVLHHQGTPIL